VNFAREQKIPVAVRGGGHNGAGLGVCDQGIVIDLSPMKGVRVDPLTNTVRAEANSEPVSRQSGLLEPPFKRLFEKSWQSPGE